MRSTFTNKRRVVRAGALALVAVCLSAVLAQADPEKKTDQKPAPNCNRCHPERYATEFTAAQWKTIMVHMRVRANLPAAQAKLILKYLQEDSGN